MPAPLPTMPPEPERRSSNGSTTAPSKVASARAMLTCAIFSVAVLTVLAVPARADSSGGSGRKPHSTGQSSPVPAYWMDATNGGVLAFGGAGSYGSASGLRLNKPIVGMSATPDGKGYWLVAADGGIFSYGNAGFHGSTGALRLNKPVVGMAPTPDGKGYWLVAADGGIFSYGDAGFHGSTGARRLARPVVGMAPTPDGKGYWLVASDGGIFAFGDAPFAGSTGARRLARPVVGMASTPDGKGYWFVASDGGIFAFGDAGFAGSMGGVTLASPVTSIASTPDGKGYWFASANGTVFAFGDAGYFGSGRFAASSVVAISEGPGTGYAPHDSGYPQGAYGSDISNWQCGATLPSGHTIGIVQVAGWSFGAVNPCLHTEATWAGSGLELYLFLTFGEQSSGPSACNHDQACNYGFAAAQHAYAQAKAAGIDASVPWWLDVEEASNDWSSNASTNASVIRGALLGLEQEGLPSAGIYSNRFEWAAVTGGSGYSPSVPEWVSDWGTNQPPFNPSQYCKAYAFASGPTWLVQYTNGATTNGFDGDYAC